MNRNVRERGILPGRTKKERIDELDKFQCTFSWNGASWKMDLDDFFDEFDIRHDKLKD